MADTAKELYPGPEARKTFGRTLKLWRLKAGWKQDTLNRWGMAAGFSGVTDAVWNKLERGLTPQPLPLTFIQLGIANDRLHRRDYGVLADRRLNDQVKAQEAICRPDGEPWTAVDFFAHFCGLEDAPEWARQETEYTISPEAAERLSEQQRAMFIRHAEDRLMDRREAWRDLAQHCHGMSHEQVAAFKRVLGGHHVWKPAELKEMTSASGGNLAINAMQEWCDTDELCAEFRELCPG